jgi:hypothetical protein
MFNLNSLSPMKKIMILAAATVIALVAVGQEFTTQIISLENTLSKVAAFNWTATEFDFGKVQKGTPVMHEFTFTNTGSEQLIISSVKASCGCTVTEYTKNPIEAGGKGFVKATYDASKAGAFTKTVTINANTEEGAVVLTIKGEVVE